MLPLLLLLQVTDPLAVVDDDIRSDQNILDYHITVSIPDRGDVIRGATTVLYRVVGGNGPLVLDFDDAFEIDSIVPADGTARPGRVREGRLAIDHWGSLGDTLAVTVYYHGAPENGLFIQENVHGVRTAFADNWPNRARHWFPGEDHPSDKATAGFAVDVPAGWRAVANGALVGVDTLNSGRTVWHWRTVHKIPVYTMVIGAGPLTVTPIPGAVPQSLWTFAPDSAFAGDVPFRRVQQVLDVLEELIGPFPYEKLAHVQSSTRFGGMENSSAIFYTENGYAERRMGEGVVAHETAHQWFGDAVTEYDWHHLWLSEGFASYFNPVFYEVIGEHETFREGMESAKRRYLASDDVEQPVIDIQEDSLFGLLNRNNYQKGAWILHMLRRTVGDSAFFGGVREYYATFRDSTALSSDLLAVMERHTDRPLRGFFEQWLLQPGYPQLRVTWDHDAERGEVVIRLAQIQPERWGAFELPVPVEVVVGGERIRGTARFDGRRDAEIRIRVPGVPTDVLIDPDGNWLLTVPQ